MVEIANKSMLLFEWGHVLKLSAKLTFADAGKHIHFGSGGSLRDTIYLFYVRKGSPIEDYLRMILLVCKSVGLDYYWEEKAIWTLKKKMGIQYVNAENVDENVLNLYHLSLFLYGECLLLFLTCLIFLFEVFQAKVK